MSDFNSTSECITERWSSLQAQWAQCRSEWNDGVAERFEREFWSEWEELVPRALPLLRELEDALHSAKRQMDGLDE